MITAAILVSIYSIAFLSLDRFKRFCIITLAVLYPLTLGSLGSISNFLVIEWLSPVFLLLTLNDLIPLRRENKVINFHGTKTFLLALAILVTWLIYSYFNNQIFSDSATIGSEVGTKRLYYSIFINILNFFSVIMFLYKNITEIEIEKWIKVIIGFSVLIGIVRVFAYFLDFDTPLIAGSFDYNPGGGTRYGGIAYRIGGLTDVAAIGMAGVIAQYYLTKKLPIIPIMLFLGVLFLSGGRTILVGLSVAVFLYSIFFMSKNLVYITVILAVTSVIILIVAPNKLLEGQLGRLSSFEGGIQQQDKGRFMSYKLSFENFKKNPIFGKGIGVYKGFISATNEREVEFVRHQLFAGGHGSYISILGTLGIGGIFYLSIMVFGGILLSFKKIRDYFYLNPNLAAIATFTFILLLIKSIYYITSQSGLNDPSLFFLTGLAAAIRVLENQQAATVKQTTEVEQ